MIDIREIENAIRKEIENKVQAELSTIDMSGMISANLNAMTQDKINAVVTGAVNSLVNSGKLSEMINEKVIGDVQARLESEIVQKASSLVARTDIGTIISEKIKEFVTDKMKQAALPDGFIPLRAINLKGLTVSPSSISPGVFSNFNSSGIIDNATSTKITVKDDLIQVDSPITATNGMMVNGSASFSSIEVRGDLKVTGNIAVAGDAFVTHINSMIDNKIAENKNSSKVDIGEHAVYSNGVELLTHNSLGAGVAFSNLRKVGNLVDLHVVDNLSVGETLHAINGKIGINTQNPNGALTVWDDDAELSVKKHRAKTTYIGTSRDGDLVIGTNGTPRITIGKDGEVGVNTITIGGIRISVSDTVPSYEGMAGELVIMSAVAIDQPWAYQCMGGKVWAALFR